MDPMEEDGPGGNTPPPGSTSSGNNTALSPGTPAAPAGSATAPNASKRKRGLGVVTPNACTECRKKRAKVRKLARLPNPRPRPCPPSPGQQR